MMWMEARAHHRESPAGLWPEAKSVIALGMSYAPASDPLAPMVTIRPRGVAALSTPAATAAATGSPMSCTISPMVAIGLRIAWACALGT